MKNININYQEVWDAAFSVPFSLYLSSYSSFVTTLLTISAKETTFNSIVVGILMIKGVLS